MSNYEEKEEARLLRGNLSPRSTPVTPKTNAPAAASSTGSTKLGGAAHKCARCQKSVFANERRVAAGKDWHESCLRCLDCGKRLDAQSLAERDGDIYCTSCYGRKFGPKGVGLSLGGMVHADGNAPGSGLQVEPDARASSPVVKQAALPPKANFCSQCGNGCAGDARFCAKCGFKLQ